MTLWSIQKFVLDLQFVFHPSNRTKTMAVWMSILVKAGWSWQYPGCVAKSRRNARPPGAFLHHIHSPHPGICDTSVAPGPDATSVTPVGDCSASCPELHLPCPALQTSTANHWFASACWQAKAAVSRLCNLSHRVAGLPSLVCTTQTGLSWPRTQKQWLPFHSKERDALSE